MKIGNWALGRLSINRILIGFLLILLSPHLSFADASCSGGTVTVCGVSIPMPGVTSVGNSTVVHVPPALLGDSASQNPNLTFTADCVANNDINGTSAYVVENLDSISCNAFPCQPSTVRLCETSIPIPGGTPLGGVLHMTMPAPFAHEAFTVECLGTGGHPAVYKITNSNAVTCAKIQ